MAATISGPEGEKRKYFGYVGWGYISGKVGYVVQ